MIYFQYSLAIVAFAIAYIAIVGNIHRILSTLLERGTFDGRYVNKALPHKYDDQGRWIWAGFFPFTVSFTLVVLLIGAIGKLAVAFSTLSFLKRKDPEIPKAKVVK